MPSKWQNIQYFTIRRNDDGRHSWSRMRVWQTKIKELSLYHSILAWQISVWSGREHIGAEKTNIIGRKFVRIDDVRVIKWSSHLSTTPVDRKCQYCRTPWWDERKILNTVRNSRWKIIQFFISWWSSWKEDNFCLRSKTVGKKLSIFLGRHVMVYWKFICFYRS